MNKIFKTFGFLCIALLLLTNVTLACDHYDIYVTLNKGNSVAKSKSIHVLKSEDYVQLSGGAYNSSNSYNLGVKLMSSDGETLTDFQLAPGKNLSFNTWVGQGKYFLVLYNPYANHLGAEGDCSLIKLPNENTGEEEAN